jgi:hypothetical protein
MLLIHDSLGIVRLQSFDVHALVMDRRLEFVDFQGLFRIFRGQVANVFFFKGPTTLACRTIFFYYREKPRKFREARFVMRGEYL